MVTVVRTGSEVVVPNVVDIAPLLDLEMDVAPSRMVEADVWVGEGEGAPMPVEVSVVVDVNGTPPNWQSVASAFASARAVRLDLGGALVEREVLALRRVSVMEGKSGWSRMRVQLVMAPNVVDLSQLRDHTGASLTTPTGAELYTASLW